MTQQERLTQSIMFAQRMKRIAHSIKSEGDGYDMKWHKAYVSQIIEASDELLDILVGKAIKK